MCKVLVGPDNKLVLISPGTGGNNVIVVDTWTGGLRKEVQQRSSCRVLLAERDNVVGREFLANARNGVRKGRVINCDRIPCLVGKACKVPISLRCSWNIGGVDLPLTEPKTLPTGEPKCLALD